MATRRIETTIALDGEQAFKQGLASAAREMRVLESESRALAAGFGSSGDAAAQAAAKQKNLQNQVSQQEQIVSALEKAVKDAAAAYGDSSAEVDGYAIKLNNARTRLANLQKALSNADREVEELGRDSQKSGQQLSKGIGDGAKEAENSLTDMMSTMQESLDEISNGTAVMAIKTIWDGAKNAYNSISGFVAGTIDYRRQLSFLQLSAEQNGFDFEDIKSKMLEVQTVTGDASSAIEGLSNLMATPGMNQDTMQRAIEGLAGAAASFPDTVKFESLADSLQETLATGEATGQFAELLGRMGYSTEEFNAALQESSTSSGDLEIALAYLAAGGMNDAYTKWSDMNAELKASVGQTAEMDAALADLAAEVDPIVTGVKSVITELIKGTTQAIKDAKSKLDKWAEEEGWTADTTGATGGGKGEYYESPYEIVNGKLVEKRQETAEQKKAGQEAGANYAEGFAEGFDAPVVIDEVGAQLAEQMGTKPLQVIGEKSMEHVLEGIDLEAYYAEMEAAGEEGGEQMVDGFEAGVEEGDATAANAGAAFGAAYARGILSQVSYVASAAAALAAAATARTQGGISGVMGMMGGVLNIDGRRAGEFLAPYISDNLAVNVE